MTKVLVVLLPLLMQLSSCVQRWLPAAEAAGTTSTTMKDLRYAMAVDEDQLVLVPGKPDSWRPRSIVLRSPRGDRTLDLPTSDTGCDGEGLSAAVGGAWTYSRCIGNGVQFASSPNGAVVFIDTGDDGGSPREWMPFPDGEPGGILLRVGTQARVTAEVVTPAGVRMRGEYDRGSSLWSSIAGSAVTLGNQRVAFVALETVGNDPPHSSLMLRWIEDQRVKSRRLSFHESGWSSVVLAVRSDGVLGVIAAPFDGSGVRAFTIDGHDTAEPVERSLDEKAAAAYPGLHLHAIGARFVGSWIRLEDGAVVVAEFSERMRHQAVPLIGDTGGASTLTTKVDTDKDGRKLQVAWTDADSRLWMRELRDPVVGSLMAQAWTTHLRSWSDRILLNHER